MLSSQDLKILKKLEPKTLKHSQNVAKLSLLIGKKRKLEEIELHEITMGALFHDIGKMFVPKEILMKPSKLTEQEMNEVKKHTDLGYVFMKQNSDLPNESLRIILEHHEKSDGSGYPHGKTEEDISELSKIVSISDMYDALVTDRVYRKALPPSEAIRIIQEESGTHFEKDLINNLIEEVGPFHELAL